MLPGHESELCGVAWLQAVLGTAGLRVNAAFAAVGHNALLAGIEELLLGARGWFVLVLRLLMLWPYGLIQPDCSNQYCLTARRVSVCFARD